MIDYHVHTRFSGDSAAEPADQLEAAAALGISEVCFTDHVDFDNPAQNFAPADLAARGRMLAGFGGQYKGVKIRQGAEISLAKQAVCLEKTLAYLAPHKLDFIIGSVHCVDTPDGMADVYYPEYHAGKAREAAYLAYLETILACLPEYGFISVLGHYDFVAKNAPYPDRAMRADLSPEIGRAFEEVFRTVVRMGKGIEINTAAWRGDPHWGLDVLRLYRAAGGEFVTFGSDAHRPSAVGNRLGEARALAAEAGIPYYAVFTEMKPAFRRIDG